MSVGPFVRPSLTLSILGSYSIIKLYEANFWKCRILLNIFNTFFLFSGKSRWPISVIFKSIHIVIYCNTLDLQLFYVCLAAFFFVCFSVCLFVCASFYLLLFYEQFVLVFFIRAIDRNVCWMEYGWN